MTSAMDNGAGNKKARPDTPSIGPIICRRAHLSNGGNIPNALRDFIPVHEIGVLIESYLSFDVRTLPRPAMILMAVADRTDVSVVESTARYVIQNMFPSMRTTRVRRLIRCAKSRLEAVDENNLCNIIDDRHRCPPYVNRWPLNSSVNLWIFNDRQLPYICPRLPNPSAVIFLGDAQGAPLEGHGVCSSLRVNSEKWHSSDTLCELLKRLRCPAADRSDRPLSEPGLITAADECAQLGGALVLIPPVPSAPDSKAKNNKTGNRGVRGLLKDFQPPGSRPPPPSGQLYMMRLPGATINTCSATEPE